ncbi:tetratricopeptide repeat protein [Sinobacterium caligoides]|nr:tetratricopeptide repeat protein [Sinobacterium caligoides]
MINHRFSYRGLLAVAVVSALAGCSGGGTLAGLDYKAEKEQPITFQQLNHGQVREEYQQLLDLFQDEELKEQIERRIADVYMLEGSHQQAVTAGQHKSYYQEAILSYQQVLEKYPNSPDNAEVLYQLAKAYDMDGNAYKARDMLLRLTTKHPAFSYNAEAYFRLGDIYFNDQDYRQAEAFYRKVTLGEDLKLAANAHYMLGWSLYKQGAYTESINAFYVVLKAVLQGNGDVASKADEALLKDTIHSMTLALAQLGGSEAIDDVPGLAKQDYVWMIYQDLGEYFLEKERFEDSAATLRRYIDHYRKTTKAPELHEQLIATYIAAGFPQQALLEKANYIDYYGVGSSYDVTGNTAFAAKINSNIADYIEQLATSYHADGQTQLAELEKLTAANKTDSKQYRQTEQRAVEAFAAAASFYQRYIDDYPAGEKVAEFTFLTAETYFSAGQYEKAISHYEQVAYERPEDENKSDARGEYAANAGYAAIIAHQKNVEALGADSRKGKRAQAAAVSSMLRFAETFPGDQRSAAVLTNAAELLFALNEYQRALDVTASLLNSNTATDNALQQTAYGIAAHCYFQLHDYPKASTHYQLQRDMLTPGSEQYQRVTERLATVVYKQAEQQQSEHNDDAALELLLSIRQLAPTSSVRVVAQYDAATMLLAQAQWPQAIELLRQLSDEFPRHELATEFPRKLAYAYEKSGSSSEAASSYLRLSKQDADAEVRREALFIAAKLYEDSGDYQTAITLFKRYAHAYEKPFETRMEARYHLATSYKKVGDKIKHLYWLRRVIDGDRKGGNLRTDRSRWLGAWACVEYGDYFAWEFSQRRLRQPLEASLPRKNESLQSATQRYQQAADYGVLLFSTQSSFKLAELYQKFAQELRQAPKPKLSAQDMRVYNGIIEQQAQPFDHLAEELHMGNISRAWSGVFNEWIDRSYQAMAVRNPNRFGKTELEVGYGDQIR